VRCVRWACGVAWSSRRNDFGSGHTRR
jgi:hypothetical protein